MQQNMPENPWNPAGSGETQQWAVPAPAPERGAGNGGLITAVVAAALALALLGGVLWWFFGSGGDSETTASTEAPSFTAPVTQTATVSESESVSEPEPTADTSTGSSGSSSSSSSSGSNSSAPRTNLSSLPSGLGYSGWTNLSGASCNADDTWVYAGGNSSTKVVVCRVGSDGDFYYRGYRNGDSLERDVDMSSADVADGYYVIPADPSTIVIDGDTLTVYRNGEVTTTEDFNGNAWADTDA